MRTIGIRETSRSIGQRSSLSMFVFLAAALLVTIASFSQDADWSSSPWGVLGALGALGILLAMSPWYSPSAEVAYVIVYAILLFDGYKDVLIYASIGVYVIVVMWVIRRWSLAAWLVLIAHEISLLVLSEDWDRGLSLVAVRLVIIGAIALAARLFLDSVNHAVRLKRLQEREAMASAARARSQLASQLHDTVAKDLTRAAMIAEDLSSEHPDLAKELRYVATTTSGAVGAIRPLIMSLNVDESVSIDQVIDECASMLDTRRMKLSVESDTPQLELEGQTLRLVHVLLKELSTNALKYGEPGTRVDLQMNCNDHSMFVTMSNTVSRAATSPQLTGGFGVRNLHAQLERIGGALHCSQRSDVWTVYAQIPIVGD
ncbi:MAG: hypothetical protein PUK40_02290 [Actinomycetaceae bacterium]|nr:hypothetical protein [Arcanobacterium sp.]MDD7504770.1 hypothetical protein [Actinomycetaceae bacterium]